MSKKIKFYVLGIVLFSIFHFFRDIMQIMGVENFLTTFYHEGPKNWCGNFCDFAAFPVQTFGLIAGLYVLKRNNLGKTGKLLVFTPGAWGLGSFLN